MAAFFSRLRITSLHRRHYSSILNPNSTAPLTSKEKTRAALSLLKSEQNPERIIDICRAASLTPESHLDRVAFSVAVTKLSKSQHFDGIRRYLEELKTRPDLQTERFAAHAIVLYGQAGMFHEAVRTFEQINEMGIPRSVKSLNSLLFAGILAHDFKEVRRVYLEFPKNYGIEPNIDTYNNVIKAFCESGSSSSVYSIFAEMDRKNLKPNATSFGFSIAGFYKEEKFDDVGKVLNMMEKYDLKPGLSIYNIRIQSLCKLKKSNEAKALLDGMISNRMKPSSVTYCHLINGYCREGKLEEAKKLFKTMVNWGCKPDSNCYFTLVYFLCQGGDFEAALQICKESMENDWIPNFATMKSLVNGLVSISKVEEARELVGKLKGRFSNNVDQWNEIETGLPQ